jgi:endoglucanase
VVRDLAAAGLMVVLDNHNSDAEWCCSFTDGNTLWYNRAYPQSAWLADWRSVARAFRGIPQVIGADLRNEPRLATWGGPHPADDWHAAAQRGGNAILAADPRWLIFVEGTVGGIDLYGVPRLPVRLKRPGRVVYSMHDYGFDHFGLTDYDSWAAQVRSEWGRLAGKYPLWLGEFGTCNTAASCGPAAATPRSPVSTAWT